MLKKQKHYNNYILAFIFSTIIISIPVYFLFNTNTKSSTQVNVPAQKVPKKQQQLQKSEYLIALYGDSMIDTMAEYEDVILATFAKKYPDIIIVIYNYGIGAQTIEQGLSRWEQPFSNRGREYPAITKVNPDIIVIGGFSYNLLSPHDPAKHKELLQKLIIKAQSTRAPVYLLAEIAPGGERFGDGEKGVNWPDARSIEHSDSTIENIKNVSAIGSELDVPIIDSYNLSKSPSSPYSQELYTDPYDGIHPSANGHAKVINLIVDTLDLE